MYEQTAFQFDQEAVHEDTSLWTPREIWVHLNQRYLAHFREDRRLERKNHVKPNLADLASYLSMFSNSVDGGVLVYGIDDDGTVTGVKFDEAWENKVLTCHLSHCPAAKPEFKRVHVIVDGRPAYCLAIYVPYIGMLVETNKNEAWIRYGDQKHLMGPEECLEFRTTRAELPFELRQAVAATYPDDFDLHIVQDFCDQYRERELLHGWSNSDVLVDRKMLRMIDGALSPTNAFLLLAGNDPGLSIPGSRLRILRFDGLEEGQGDSYSPLKDHTVEGNIVKVLRRANELMQTLLYDVTWLNEEGKFVTTPEYPTHAWQEALINALVHRSYAYSGTEITIKIFENRMEVESPGGFIPPVSEKSIYSSRASRNHHLMDALRMLGYVRMAREGTRRIRESMSQYRLPEPQFRQEALNGVVVKVTLRNDFESRKRSSEKDVALHFGVDIWRKLSEEELTVAGYLFHNRQVQVVEVERMLNRNWKTAKRLMTRLVEKGVAEYVPGEYYRDSKAHYRLK